MNILISTELLSKLKDELSNYKFYSDDVDSYNNYDVIEVLDELDTYLKSIGVEL